MIQANELRVGNWIADHEAGGYFQIEEIYKDSYGTYSASYRNRSIRCTIDALEEIPLTEEWLTKFGFEKNVSDFWLNDKWCLGLYMIEKYVLVNLPAYNFYLHKLQYVHQLQNLYFALTGQELTIKTKL